MQGTTRTVRSDVHVVDAHIHAAKPPTRGKPLTRGYWECRPYQAFHPLKPGGRFSSYPTCPLSPHSGEEAGEVNANAPAHLPSLKTRQNLTFYQQCVRRPAETRLRAPSPRPRVARRCRTRLGAGARRSGGLWTMGSFGLLRAQCPRQHSDQPLLETTTPRHTDPPPPPPTPPACQGLPAPRHGETWLRRRSDDTDL